MMSEYILQTAMKVEVSTDHTKSWSLEDIIELLKVSLSMIPEETDAGETDKELYHDKINFIYELLKQFPPKLIKTETTSYLFKKSIKYYFYVGMISDDNKPQRYEVFTCAYDNPSIRGKNSISHTVVTEDGELKVLGVARFTPKPKDYKSKIPKITCPQAMLNKHKMMMTFVPRKQANVESQLTTTENKQDHTKTAVKRKPYSTKIASKQFKKKTKTSGLNSMLKFLAPGTSGLFQGNGLTDDDTASGDDEAVGGGNGEADYRDPNHE